MPLRPLTLAELERAHGVAPAAATSIAPGRGWPLLALVFALSALFGFALSALVIPALHAAPALA